MRNINNYISQVTSKRSKKLRMDRDIPVFNRPVMQKIFRKNQQRHLQRLRNIKTGYSNRTMAINPNHTLSNKKAVLVEQQKRTQIEKQNVLLFNKMMRIMKRNDPNNQPNLTQYSRINKASESQNSRILEENRGILQRIQHQKPTISNKKLQEDRLKNINILRFLGKYPNTQISGSRNYDATSSQMGRKSENKRKYDSYYHRGQQPQDFQLDQELYEEEIKTYQMEVQKLKQRSLPSSSGRRKYQSQSGNRANIVNKIDSEESEGLMKLASVDVPSQIPLYQQNHRPQQRQYSKTSTKSDHDKQPTQFFQQPHPTKQIILFQKHLQINKIRALVHIIRSYNIYKIRAAFQQAIKGNNIYELQIPEQEGNQFFSENNYDYHRICRMLVIEDGCLVVNPGLADRGEREGRVGEKEEGRKRSGEDKIGSDDKMEVGYEMRKQVVMEGEHWGKYQQALQEYIQ